jgi:hypothetical protein
MSCVMLARLALAGAAAACVTCFHPAKAAHAEVGTLISNPEMPRLGGGTARLFEDAAVNVLVFFRPNQEHSRETLREMAGCQKRTEGASVRWVAIVSGAADADSAAAMAREARLDAPVLVDGGDALYGSLGVVLHPVVVIAGRDRRLAAFEPFRSVNLCAIVTARIRRVLGEISDEELQAVLAPPKAVNGGDAQVARRNLRLAEALFRS